MLLAVLWLFIMAHVLTLMCALVRQANVLARRYMPRSLSDLIAQQAVATACIFLASKVDSVYHRLDNICHTAICELRRAQNRSMEPEYFNPDGVGGVHVIERVVAGVV